MALDPKENHQELKDDIQNERRSFLKKAAYAAPGLIVLGQLARPTKTKANFGPPPSAPNWPDE